MGHDWVVGVLADMSRYAGSNGLPQLSAHLQEAVHLALAECAGHEPVEGRACARAGAGRHLQKT